MPTILRKQLMCKFYCVFTSVMTSQIFVFVHSPKTQKSKYLENETLFFSNKKNHSL